MNISTRMTHSTDITVISTPQLEGQPPQDHMIKSDDEFIAKIIPQLEQIMPAYHCDGVLPHPMAIYYGKNDGEYVYALFDTAFNWCLYPSDWDDFSLVLMAVYFGSENGEHYFCLCDESIIAERTIFKGSFSPTRIVRKYIRITNC